MTNDWENLDEIKCHLLSGCFGFIYEIRNYNNGLGYIGAKQYIHKKKVKKKGGGYYQYDIDSGWETYWGSNDALKADFETAQGVNFTKTALCFAKTKGDLKYLEAREIFMRDAIASDLFYNEYIASNSYRKSALSRELLMEVNG